MQKVAINHEAPERSRAYLQDATYFERRLWGCLRERSLQGFRFRRQVTLGPYIVDYLCHEARLIVELDEAPDTLRASYDLLRTRYLEKCGFRVLRYWNTSLSHNLEEVLHEIDGHLYAPPTSWSEARA